MNSYLNFKNLEISNNTLENNKLRKIIKNFNKKNCINNFPQNKYDFFKIYDKNDEKDPNHKSEITITKSKGKLNISTELILNVKDNSQEKNEFKKTIITLKNLNNNILGKNHIEYNKKTTIKIFSQNKNASIIKLPDLKQKNYKNNFQKEIRKNKININLIKNKINNIEFKNCDISSEDSQNIINYNIKNILKETKFKFIKN